ncbi:MAG: hypothetical protein ACOY33_05040 [Pseudomonadota bacterium]
MTNNAPALPEAARQHLERGKAHHAAKNLAAALQEYQAASRLAPDSEPVLFALGALAMDAHDWTAAEKIQRHLEILFPGRHRARLALAIFNQQRHADALPVLEQLAAEGRMDLNCALAYAVSLERCGQPERAVQILQDIYRGSNSESAAVLLASALLRMGRRTDLDEWLPRLLQDHPHNTQLLAGRSEHAFLSGDYATGFDYMHYRWAVAMEPPKSSLLACPAWDGQRFDGTLLVAAEQGLGDEILSSSVFEELVRIGQPSLIDCEPRLLPLLRRSFPALEFCDRKSDMLVQRSREPATRKIDAMELGRFFRRDIARMPERNAWLVADPQRTAEWRSWLAEHFPDRRAVGVSWRSTRHLIGDSKSIPVTDLRELLGHPGFACINLQYGDTGTDRAQLQATGLSLHQPPGLDLTGDIDGLCALIAALDAVVTCSNTTAHLAGALGIPTRVMLPGGRYVLWYWGHDGETTPWYRSLRLFRGPPRKSWPALAADVVTDLAALPCRSRHA